MNEKPSNRPRAGFIALTPEMISALYEECRRTGVSVPALAKHYLDPTLGITQRQIHQWMLGLIKSADPKLYTCVLRSWRGLPGLDEEFVVYSSEVRAAMDAERTRTGIAAVQIFTNDADLPDGLTRNKIRNFYCGVLTRLDRRAFEHIMRTWNAFPDADSATVALTPDILAALRAGITRTNKGPSAILRGARDRPDGLHAALIQTWLSGKTRTARSRHLDYVMNCYSVASPASAAKRGRPLKPSSLPS